ncbi:hypothetical protein [Azospirillum largimobile]
MAVTVSCKRLDRVKVKMSGGQRQYMVYSMPADDMAAIDLCLRIALGL